MRKILISMITAAFVLSSTALAAYDPIDETEIMVADGSGVTLTKNSTAMFGKLYAAAYDEDGRLVEVSSAPLEWRDGDDSYGYYSYHELGIDPDIIKSKTKLMLWSTYTDDMRPAANTYTLGDIYNTAADYGTADNNPTMIVKRILSGTDDDGETVYTVVGYSQGGEVRYTTKANTLIAKMTEPFNGSRYYIGEELWRADSDMGTDFTDLIKPGDIVGVKDYGRIFMIMTDAQELIDGVKSGEIPELYNMLNFGVSDARDNIIMGALESVEINDTYAFISTHGYNMGMDIGQCIDVITVSADGEVTIDKENLATVFDLIPFDAETGKGDYLYVRYANKGNLQDVHVYRFE